MFAEGVWRFKLGTLKDQVSQLLGFSYFLNENFVSVYLCSCYY